METIQSILYKLNQLTTLEVPITLIEKDLMLQLTRNLYEEITELHVEKAASELQSLPQKVIEDMEEALQEEEIILDKEEEHIELEEVEANFEFDEDADFIDDPAMENLIEKAEPETVDKSYQTSSEETLIEPQNPIQLQELKETKNVLAFKLWNKDIRSYIGINDKYNFISELFGNNAESYEEILNEINLCGSKAEVLQFLENSGITTLYKWDVEGFSVQSFYGVLSQFFSTK